LHNDRTITLGDKVTGKSFCSNEVITSHYTPLTFIPLNIYEQFCKTANVYFLTLCILQVIPYVSVTQGIPTIALPLTTVLFMNAIKDAVEDWRRHKSDAEENARLTQCVEGGKLLPKKWKDVHVGDLLLIKNMEMIPCDLIIFCSADKNGGVYIETANLDGETNLKAKAAHNAANLICGQETDHKLVAEKVGSGNVTASIVCEAPNEFLYTFVGRLQIQMKGGQESQCPLSEGNILLRGSKLRSVAWALGMVVYTGRETKIQMNSTRKTSRKVSHVEKELTRFTMVIFGLMCVLCTIAALVNASHDAFAEQRTVAYNSTTWGDDGVSTSVLRTKTLPDPTYLLINDWSFPVLVIVKFGTFLLLFSNFIPISLLVSVSFAKLIQTYFIHKDKNMIWKGHMTIPRTTELNEELGQIEYVFSDKTGTLTCNIMDFRKFTVNGASYGEGITEIRRNVLRKMGEQVPEDVKPEKGAKITPHVNLVDKKIKKLMNDKSGEQYAAVCKLFLHMSINHEVIPEYAENGDLTYSASSPDEEALVFGARHFGYTLKQRDQDHLTITDEAGTAYEVDILAVLKFSSRRKRSSVLVRFPNQAPPGHEQGDFPSEGSIILFCKGADNVMMEKLSEAESKRERVKRSVNEMSVFAEDGLRTLVFAGRKISQTEYDNWTEIWDKANLATTNRQDQVENAADVIEKNLELHGMTGIEDNLQGGVGETIGALMRAGMKVWMLTGDKVETAINIGIATGMLELNSDLGRAIITAQDLGEPDGSLCEKKVVDTLTLNYKKVEAAYLDAQGKYARHYSGTLVSRKVFEAVVIDGRCLEVALEPENCGQFADMCKACKTVICCRVSPQQKGAVVRLIKHREKAITLAVGDGANDCNMIQSADVGIGIRGLEGLQAFNVCDYAISQFKFLRYLLLLHGRWCYRRVTTLVNYMFYKNVVVVLPQYFLGAVSGFSGQKLYNDILYQLYNVAFTSIPILLYGILDRDVSKRMSLKFPELYMLGPAKRYLDKVVFMRWIAVGIWHGLVVFWIPYFAMANGSITHSDGKHNDIWMVGTVVFFMVILVTNLKVFVETYDLTWLTWFGLVFSLFWWFAFEGYFSGLHGAVSTTELHGTMTRLFGCPMLYIIMFVTTITSMLWDIQAKAIETVWFPNVLHRVQEEMALEGW